MFTCQRGQHHICPAALYLLSHPIIVHHHYEDDFCLSFTWLTSQIIVLMRRQNTNSLTNKQSDHNLHIRDWNKHMWLIHIGWRNIQNFPHTPFFCRNICGKLQKGRCYGVLQIGVAHYITEYIQMPWKGGEHMWWFDGIDVMCFKMTNIYTLTQHNIIRCCYLLPLICRLNEFVQTMINCYIYNVSMNAISQLINLTEIYHICHTMLNR